MVPIAKVYLDIPCVFLRRVASKLAKKPIAKRKKGVRRAPAVGGESSIASSQLSADTLGAFLPSHDDTRGVPKYAGMVRGVFETKAMPSKAGGGSGPGHASGAYAIEPGAPQGSPLSPLWIVLLKKVEEQGDTIF